MSVSSELLFLINFFFWMHWVFVAVHGLSLVVMCGGFLIMVASLLVEHGL